MQHRGLYLDFDDTGADDMTLQVTTSAEGVEVLEVDSEFVSKGRGAFLEHSGGDLTVRAFCRENASPVVVIIHQDGTYTVGTPDGRAMTDDSQVAEDEK